MLFDKGIKKVATSGAVRHGVTVSGATTGGNGGSRLRAPLERGRRVQTEMFFLFCLITKFCHILWLPMTLHSIHFAQYAHALPLTIIS